jgi:hypothetical protein
MFGTWLLHLRLQDKLDGMKAQLAQELKIE